MSWTPQGEKASPGPAHVHVDLVHKAAGAGQAPVEPPAARLHGGCMAILHKHGHTQRYDVCGCVPMCILCALQQQQKSM